MTLRDVLIIKTRRSVNANAPLMLQKIDTNTGKVDWSIVLKNTKGGGSHVQDARIARLHRPNPPVRVVPYKDGFFAYDKSSCDDSFLIGDLLEMWIQRNLDCQFFKTNLKRK